MKQWLEGVMNSSCGRRAVAVAGEQLPWQENSDSGRRLEVGRSAMVMVGEKWLSQEAVCGRIAVIVAR